MILFTGIDDLLLSILFPAFNLVNSFVVHKKVLMEVERTHNVKAITCKCFKAFKLPTVEKYVWCY